MPVGGSRRVLRFEAFALDLSRCTLRRGSEELPLRPKSFDVLRYLAEHPSRVVSKAELFEAVWPQVSVTDDSLVQCIKEVRQALGDSERLLLRTVAKRGYVLDARVAQDDDPGRPADAGPKVASELPAETSGGSLASATQRSFWRAGIIARWRRPALVVAVAIILIAASAGALVALRPQMPNDNAAHHAILATALLDKESSRPIIREAIIHYNKALALDPGNVLALVGSRTRYRCKRGVGAIAGAIRAACSGRGGLATCAEYRPGRRGRPSHHRSAMAGPRRPRSRNPRTGAGAAVGADQGMGTCSSRARQARGRPCARGHQRSGNSDAARA